MDRRQLLTRLPFFGAAVALPSSTLASLGPQENPALVALGSELDRHVRAYASAKQAKADARGRYDMMAPDRPPELIMHGRSDQLLYGCGETEVDVEGNSTPERNGRIRFVVRRWELAERLAKAQPRFSYARDLRRRIKAFDQYEAAVEAAKHGSGLADAIDAVEVAAWELHDLVEKVCRAEARTPAGLLFKARALVANKDLPSLYRIGWGGPLLADAVIAVLGEAGR